GAWPGPYRPRQADPPRCQIALGWNTRSALPGGRSPARGDRLATDDAHSLAGKVALVTGASRGIGAAIARELGRQGASVTLNYQSSAEAAQRVASEVEAAGSASLVVQADVAAANDVDRLVKAVEERFGRLDILVNNAGITRDKLLLRMRD